MRSQRYHGLRFAFLAATVAAAAWWWSRRRPFAVAVEGSSMAPTLLQGDLLLATLPSARGVSEGALVIVEHPDRPGYEVVKRVVRAVGRDGLWVEGDNPSMSSDSRSFGPVERGAIRGVVWLRYWPPARAGRL